MLLLDEAPPAHGLCATNHQSPALSLVSSAMEDLGKDAVAACFTMLTERLSAVEALTEATRVKVEVHALLTTLARQALRSRCQEVVDPQLMFLDQGALGGARVARLLSALEGSSQ